MLRRLACLALLAASILGGVDQANAQAPFDVSVGDIHCPAEPVPQHDLAGCHSHIITGQVAAATLRSLFRFGTHQVDPPDISQVAHRVPDAKLLSLGFCPIRHEPNGAPL